MIEVSRRQRDLLISLCLVLATAAVYWPVQRFEFTNYDDSEYVSENPHVLGGLTLKNLSWAFTTQHASNWHPLTWISHMLDCQWFGVDAGGHHLVNLLFHIANTLLLFGVLKRMTAAPWRSALVAALFALHPLHVESVAWVAERKDVLSAFFWMLTLWAYVRYVEQLNAQHPSPLTHRPLVRRSLGEGGSSHMYYALTLLLFALGLMAKPMLVTLPFVLLLLDYWPLGRTRWAPTLVSGSTARESAKRSASQLLMEKLPFLLLTAASCVVTCWAQRAAVLSLDYLSMGDRFANAVATYLRYLGNVLWPCGLAVFYPHQRWSPDAVAGAGAVLLAVSVWAILSARRTPQFVVGWLWYLGMLVPVIGLMQVGIQSRADRYTYLPLIGVFMMVAWAIPDGVVEQRMRKTMVALVAVVLLGVCAVLSRRQVSYWQNGVTLFEHALAVTQDNHVAYYNLGSALAREGRIAEALGQFEEALRLKPRNADVHFNLGLALALLGRTSEAVEHYEQALQISPNDAARQYTLANILRKAGRAPEAIGRYEQLLRLKPDFAEAHFNLGLALSQAGRFDNAVGQFEQALRLKPEHADAHFNLGLALEQTGRLREAIGHYEQTLRFKPHFAEAQNNLAWLLATLAPANGGDPVRAVTLAQRLCQTTGNHVAAYLDTLAAAYAAAGRFAEAIATAQAGSELARAAKQPQVVKEIEAHLQLYRSGHAYVQPSH